MIKSIEHIHVPMSGVYKERIYDIESSWNSQIWTWIKFENNDLSEWCGEFRGEYIGHALSKLHSTVLILTTDYLFQLNIENGELQFYEEKPEYKNLTVTPNGDYVVSSYYDISIIENCINKVVDLKVELRLDKIKFIGWENLKLKIRAEEVLNWDNHITYELDGETLELKMIKQSKL